MAAIATVPLPMSPAPCETLADLQRRLGGVPLERIRCQPPPGAATEDDVLRCLDSGRAICELVDGVLVEKATGFTESRLAAVLSPLRVTCAALRAMRAGQPHGVVSGRRPASARRDTGVRSR